MNESVPQVPDDEYPGPLKADELRNKLEIKEIPTFGKLAGIDFGTVRVGIAVCDPSQKWSTPLETYNRRNTRLDAKWFLELAKTEAIVGWILGLPVHCDGNESQKSKEVREFALWLHETTKLPYAFYDERFTTAEARNLLNQSTLSGKKRKQQLDQIAAHLILSHFLGNRESTSSNMGIED